MEMFCGVSQVRFTPLTCSSPISSSPQLGEPRTTSVATSSPAHNIGDRTLKQPLRILLESGWSALLLEEHLLPLSLLLHRIFIMQFLTVVSSTSDVAAGGGASSGGMAELLKHLQPRRRRKKATM